MLLYSYCDITEFMYNSVLVLTINITIKIVTQSKYFFKSVFKRIHFYRLWQNRRGGVERELGW